MRSSPRPRRTRKEFHASEEMEEMLGHMFPRWPKRAGVRGVKKSENSSQLKKSKKCFVLHVLGELPKNSTQTRNRRNVELYVPKLAQRPELGIRLGVLSFQYKHWWDFSYKSFTGCKIVKQCGFCYLRLGQILTKNCLYFRKHLSISTKTSSFQGRNKRWAITLTLTFLLSYSLANKSFRSIFLKMINDIYFVVRFWVDFSHCQRMKVICLQGEVHGIYKHGPRSNVWRYSYIRHKNQDIYGTEDP